MARARVCVCVSQGQDLLQDEEGSVGDLFGQCDVNLVIVLSPCLTVTGTSD